jgi:glycosyltransferase involved in cell wall biosynthesis
MKILEVGMKIDFYSLGNPWDPNLWSGTNLELATTLKDFGVLRNAYNVNPDLERGKFERIVRNLIYFRFNEGRIRFMKAHNPRYFNALRDTALKIYEHNSKPDAILTIDAVVSFNETPFFTFQDLDIATILNIRVAGKKTLFPIFDLHSINTLRKRQESQLNVYAKAKGILVASNWIANSIRSYVKDPGRVRVVGMGHKFKPIEVSESLLEKRFERPKILFVGKDGMRKGLDLVVSAFENVQEEIPEAELGVVTDYAALPAQLKKVINSNDNIRKYTKVSQQNLQELYLSSSVFFMPSRFEPWGKVFFEAMAFSLPVIGAKCCAMPEFIIDGHNGFTVKHNVDEATERIAGLFGSYGKYKDISKNAVKVSENYTWKKVVGNILNIMDTDRK